MFQEIGRCAGLLLTLFAAGCADIPESDPRYCELSRLLPVWIIEDDSNVLEMERKDLDRDRGIEKMLVIPVYKSYRHAGATDQIAIAHPFLYHPGDEIEARLRSFGQRDKLVRLVFWARGYFPSSIAGHFIWSPVVNGKRMIVKELQRCLGSEEAEIAGAMKELVQESEFVVGDSPERPAIPDTKEVITVDFHYNAAQVVRSLGYESRFFRLGYTRNTHLLWAYAVGTKIVNRFSAEEKKMVADFAAGGDSTKNLSQNHQEKGPRPGNPVAPKGSGTGSKNLSPNRQRNAPRPEIPEVSERSGIGSKNAKSGGKVLDGTYSGEGFSLTFEQGKCYCVDKASKERAETKYVVKDGKVYIAPIVPPGKKMTRNAWPAYTIKGDSLESSHVEDMDTGEVFYKDKMPRAVLVRVRDRSDK